MKTTITVALCALAAFSLTTYPTEAKTISNNTGMSSMYGVNGQFEHYNEAIVHNPSMYKRAIKQKKYQLTAAKLRLQKFAALKK